jgi:TatD DNase family protein
MSLRLFDAHNHLQDDRLASIVEDAMAAARSEGLAGVVVNGSSEEDWQAVLELSQRYPEVIPSFGCHPWYVRELGLTWRETLTRFLDSVPSAIGEIGLDRWIKDFDLPAQEEVFVSQLRMAAERNVPASIHCLKAWGRLYDLLKAEPRPACGFVLHSFGGPVEMIASLARLGAYFSLPGYFAHERKTRQREAFRHVPIDRLLIETDAPDQMLPESRSRHAATDAADGKPINHPANIAPVYEFAAELLGQPLEELAGQVEENFKRIFGLLQRTTGPGA